MLECIISVGGVHKNLNPLLSIDGIILTMFDKRNKLSTQVTMDVKKHLQEKVFETMIPRNVRVPNISFGMPVIKAIAKLVKPI